MGETIVLDIRLNPCNQEYLSSRFPKLKCETNQTKITQFIKEFKVRYMITSKFFDSQDFSSDPIKASVDIRRYFVNSQSLRQIVYNLQPNQAIGSISKLHESLSTYRFDYYQTNLESTSSLERIETDPYIVFRIKMKNDFTIIERSLNNFVQLLSNTGGLLGIITFIVNILIGWLQEFFFIQSMLKKRFLVNDHENSIKSLNINASQPQIYLQLIHDLWNRKPFYYTTKEAFLALIQ
ncbi:UNKNOWN [Stylonychia lemnae]|uniref:Uncharacterized protein n=1 Tax=Stylonychia lemnae TaxID=5949 RepID=A0A077ZVA7_STYLE|nr:UNKNOWN [Stylonychia lemnae]|eukprot:CDW73559.1 UNKNOWN [Stylonychia lemnae]